MSEKGFLERWSARKRAARADAPERAPDEAAPEAPAETAAAPEGPAAPEAETEPEISEEELSRLPPIEEARTPADLRPYLRRGVPAALKQAAMRRIWMLNPAIRDYVDPALDYAWDFNAAAGPGAQAESAAKVARLVGTLLDDAPEAARKRPTPPAKPVTEAPPAPAPAATETADPRPPDAGGGEPASARRRHGGALPQVRGA